MADNSYVQLLSAKRKTDFCFVSWYRLLKRCYPVPDGALAFMFRVNPNSFARWKAGQRSPSPSATALIALLVMIRIGLPRSTYDLIHPPSREALEVLVERYLELEEIAIAKRRLRDEQKEAARLAKVVPKVDTGMCPEA